MDLNIIQLDQLKRYDSHHDYYLKVMANYTQSFPIHSKMPKGNIVDRVIWNNVNQKELISNFITVLEIRKFTFESTVKGHLKVKDKSKEILELIKMLLDK